MFQFFFVVVVFFGVVVVFFGVVVFCSSVDGDKGRYGGVAAYSEAAELLYNAFVR